MRPGATGTVAGRNHRTNNSVQLEIISTVQFVREKTHFWSGWLTRVERMKSICPKVAARLVRRRFRHNVSGVAPQLSPASCATPAEQAQCMSAWQTHFHDAASLDVDSFCVRHFDRVPRRVARIRANRGAGCNASTPFTGSELQDALNQGAIGQAPGCDVKIAVPTFKQSGSFFLARFQSGVRKTDIQA